MTVVHFTKVSALYPRVVILSLHERLENLIFAILYTFFIVWPRDHYMTLQMFTMGHISDLAKVVRSTTTPLTSCEPEQITMPLSTHPSKTYFSHHL
jgi:hypothetical protein